MTGMLRRFLRRSKLQVRRLSHPVSRVDIRSSGPFERDFGYHRGTPVDRYYIEKFIARNKDVIRYAVIEVGDKTYSSKWAPPESHIRVMNHAVAAGAHDVVIDLEDDASVPPQTADCFILTQVLNFVFDVPTAAKSIVKVLKPGGVALVTVAGVSQISEYDETRWGDYWRFTRQSLRRVFEDAGAEVEVESFGNCLASTCLFQGVVVEDLQVEDLDVVDPVYPVIICAVVRRSGADQCRG